MLKKIKNILFIFSNEEIDIKYKITAIIGIIIRYIALGFLCKSLIHELGTTIGIITSICSFIINYLIEKPLYKFTYLEAGIFYESGGKYAIGSALYTIFYLLNCALIFIIIWLYKYWIYYISLLSYITIVLITRGIVGIIRKLTSD